MVFFHSTSFWRVQALWKYHMFWPVSRCQQLLAVIFRSSKREHVKYFSFTTTLQFAIPAESKATHVMSIKSKSEDKEREKGECSAGGDASSHAFARFSSGAASRRAMNQENLPMIFKNIPTFEKPLSVEEWEELKEEFKGMRSFESEMLKQMIKRDSSIHVAKSLLSMVAKKEGDISYDLLLKYLALCVQQKQTAEAHEVCNIMKARYKTLETGAYSLMIKVLSDSSQWREALLLLEERKKITTPSLMNYGNCIKAALNNGEIKLACELYHEMLAKDLMPKFETLQVFFDTGKCMKDDQFKSELLGILLHMRENQIYPGEDLTQSIKLWFESIPGETWRGRFTGIKNSGKCSVCNQNLENINLSLEEYNGLKKKIMKNVIQGGDVFRRTTPQELERFKNFVTNQAPYDIVLDGLNVARIVRRRRLADNLHDVVTLLAQQNLRLLVLGRKHMLQDTHKWGKRMDDIKRKADVFFADNISDDDPFLLYATLHSGRHCKFVTKDHLRDHKACLPDNFTRHLFFKWQRGHQLVIRSLITGKRVKFQPIPTYDTVVQTTGNTWHIPYDEKLVKRCSYEVPTKWLCLQRKK